MRCTSSRFSGSLLRNRYRNNDRKRSSVIQLFGSSVLYLALSGVDQATALGFRDRISELLRGIKPETNRFLRVGECSLLTGAMRGAPRELGDFGNERLILLAP